MRGTWQTGASVALLAAALNAGAEVAPRFDCFIEPNQLVEVGSPAEGILKRLQVDKSAQVGRGQALFALDSEVEQATLSLAQARARMQDEIRARETSLAHAQRKLERVEQLYSRQVIPLHQKEEVETEVALARLQLQQARENRQLAWLEAKRAQTLLRQREVSSPIDGVVVKIYKYPGEYVEGEAVIQLAQLDPLKVELILPVQMFGQIRPGMQADIVPEIQSEQPLLPATVSVVDRVADVSSGTFGVQLALPNPEGRLPSGLKCNVSFRDALPPAAVLSQQ